jgi:hypothetical protein
VGGGVSPDTHLQGGRSPAPSVTADDSKCTTPTAMAMLLQQQQQQQQIQLEASRSSNDIVPPRKSLTSQSDDNSGGGARAGAGGAGIVVGITALQGRTQTPQKSEGSAHKERARDGASKRPVKDEDEDEDEDDRNLGEPGSSFTDEMLLDR